ncbi:MAG: putative SOS response-associated peptidase YedK [Natronomonas sp.]|jgi:putative SOS response-associated peptidase YedK|uniref:SOS response-associated peptidase n=1 Tax=Natronomonas sp. TaxID=2184060 RepID=UPI003989BE5A
MCGRYSLFTPPEELEDCFGASFTFEFEPRYNAAPSQQLPVITDAESDAIQRLEWGLVPRWADDCSDGHINARAETVDEKPAFADAYESRRCPRERSEGGLDTPDAGRCLVLADGFYEWADRGDGKRPYRVAFEDDRPFAMAGLWERWTPDTLQTGLGSFGDGGDTPDQEPDPIETFTIVTTEPNSVVEPLHHRMAVVLDPEEETTWLEGEDVLLDPAPADGFHAYPVSTAVNNPGNDRPALIEAVEPS